METTMGAAADRLDVRVLRFRTDPRRDEPAMLAQQLLSTGRTGEALELTGRALEQEPADVDLLLMHGVGLTMAGELETAQLAFMRAAKIASEWAEPWAHLAETLMARGKPERALQVAERGLEIDPRHRRLEVTERAARLEVRALRFLERPSVDEPAMLAQELLASGRSEAAFEVTRHALLDDIDDEDLLVTHARAARAQGDLDEAVSVLRMATYEAPDWTTVWALLAEVLEERGERDRAREAAQKALLLDPTDPELFALYERLEPEPPQPDA